MRFLAPVAAFAISLAAFEWIATGRLTTLALRSALAAIATALAARAIPWSRWALSVNPRGAAFRLVLFALFMGHFSRTILEEARRTLIARRRCLPRTFGPGWFHSLQWAAAAIFRRTLLRAERFYAAQLMKGLAE